MTGDRIKALRGALELGQDAFAAVLGLGSQALQQWEKAGGEEVNLGARAKELLGIVQMAVSDLKTEKARKQFGEVLKSRLRQYGAAGALYELFRVVYGRSPWMAHPIEPQNEKPKPVCGYDPLDPAQGCAQADWGIKWGRKLIEEAVSNTDLRGYVHPTILACVHALEACERVDCRDTGPDYIRGQLDLAIENLVEARRRLS